MDPRTQERVEEWDSRPFNGGFDGLSDLADADFSGAVSAAGTWLFMLNGRIIGVVDGDIEDFETASGTRYEAPHPSLPLLCTMEERGGETRANYYTNETPLREVDETLQSGSFTGYVELSENVLSGDYYAVYYGGRRMAAAYIGNAERLLTGDEAFERAADEVGIYEVVDVEIDVTDVPGSTDDPAPESETASTTDSGAADAAGGVGTSGEPTADGSTADSTEQTADATDSSIEPIDLSGTDSTETDETVGSKGDDAVDAEPSLSSEIDLTDDPAGITTSDDDGTEPVSAGITAAEPDPDPDADTDLDPDPDGATVTGDETPVQESPEESETAEYEYTASETVSGEESESDPEATPAESETAASSTAETDATDAPSAVDDESSVDSASTTDPDVATTAPGSDEASTADDDTASPDLAEVEAAAEELDRNDISWVDEDDETATGDEAATDDGDLEEQFEREEEWRETRRIPSIDPDNSSSDSSQRDRETRPNRSSTDRSATETETAAASSNPARADSQASARADPSTESAAASGSRERSRTQQSERSQGGTDDATAASSDRVEALTEKLETLQEQRDALATKADELESERDRLRSENEELSATVDRLQSRIDDLETELERARERDAETGAAGASGGADAGTRLSPQQALSGTNLFVRYASKSQPTLETAHGGDADRSDVAANLQLEHHTQFDSADAVVDGEPYADFLPSTMEYRFVDWLTEMLLYEIRDTGNADGLGDLYDAIPKIDRAELGATISLADDETDDVPEQVTFDIVAFDKMGNPLVLVTLNDSREPASEELLAELEEAASAVKANYPDLAAAIAVTSSYFEPGALEVAEQATSGGLLSRGSKLSYVNLSRKAGYHLCLVESRSEGFHMNVPEL